MSDHERSSESESQTISRRAAIKKTVNAGLAAGAVMSAPSWVLPALAQGEELVPFSDMPEDYSRPPARPGGTHFLDTRQISSDSFYTDNQDFYVVQHYGQPELDLSSYRLQITGLVDNPVEYTLAEVGISCDTEQETRRPLFTLIALPQGSPLIIDLDGNSQAIRMLGVEDELNRRPVTFEQPLWLIKGSERYAVGTVRNPNTMKGIVEPICQRRQEIIDKAQQQLLGS